MDPTLTAAAIGVTGTVVVGVAGFGATIWTTRRTIRAARDARIWDERARAYVDTLAAIGFRQEKRMHDTQTVRLDDETQRAADQHFGTYVMPNWFDLEARLHAFGSERVVEAVRRSSEAHGAALDAFQTWREKKPSTADDRRAKFAQLAIARTLSDAAIAADDSAIVLIRAQLQGRRR